jgi:hypothetical protein
MTVKRVQVTFDNSLPLGTRGTFIHEKQLWIAVPMDKWTETVSVTDRLLGIVSRVRTQLTQWVGTRPEDSARIVPVLQILAAAEALVHEKQKAQTQ